MEFKNLILIVVLYMLLLVAMTTWVAGCFGMTRQLNDVRAMTVLVSSEGFDGTGRGTGLLLDQTHVLTCAHMVDRGADLMVYTYPLHYVYFGHPEYINRGDDLAIVVLDDSATIKSFPTFQDKIELGEPVTVIGNALGAMKWFVTKGIIAGNEHQYLLTDALVNPGNSGGPWMNDKGEIVALTDWRIGPSPHIPGLAGGVSAATIKEFLADYRRRGDFLHMFQALSSDGTVRVR
jgi:serine protease Do